jgi:hypothetical protein
MADKEFEKTTIGLTLAERSFLRWVADNGGNAGLDMRGVSDKTSAKVKDMERRGFILLTPVIGRGEHYRALTLTPLGVRLVDAIDKALRNAQTNIITNEYKDVVEFEVKGGDE